MPFPRPLLAFVLAWLLAGCSASPREATALFATTLSDRE